MTTDPLDLDELEKLAEAAQDPEGWYDPRRTRGYHIAGNDLAYVVALPPSTTLALVAVVRAARAFMGDDGYSWNRERDGDPGPALTRALERFRP